MPRGLDRVTRLGTLIRLGAALLVAVALALGGTTTSAVDAASPAKPNYLPYAEFSADDTPPHVALKQAYNQAVLRYNQALYDYHVTLEKHDHLVEVYNTSPDSAERDKAREEAGPLRTKLATLKRDVTARAAEVDQAARRAAVGGVSVRR